MEKPEKVKNIMMFIGFQIEVTVQNTHCTYNLLNGRALVISDFTFVVVWLFINTKRPEVGPSHCFAVLYSAQYFFPNYGESSKAMIGQLPSRDTEMSNFFFDFVGLWPYKFRLHNPTLTPNPKKVYSQDGSSIFYRIGCRVKWCSEYS